MKEEIPNEEKLDKNKALKSLFDKLNKEYGDGTIMKFGDKPIKAVSVIPTGILTLDIALGIGGIPRGRIIEIFGPESSGKTTLTLHIIAQAQKAGGTAAFVDAEHAFDPNYAKKLGVDVSNLIFSQPDSGEQALEITETLVRSGAVDVVIVDSVAALVPKAELDGDMGDATMGAQARLMSQAMRKLTGITNKTKTSVIFINQIRQKIGVMFGSPETTTGGNALKFYCSLRMDIRRVETIKKGDDSVGNHVKVKVVKNKLAPPFKQAEFDIFFNEGAVREACVLEAAVSSEIVKRSGTWYVYNDENIGQGKDKTVSYLKENLEFCNKLEEQVKMFHGFISKLVETKVEEIKTEEKKG